MKELEQIILADAYHHNSPKAWAWIGGVLMVVMLFWWLKKK